MLKKSTTSKENLFELEKLVRRIIRKTLKDNTLDYTVQYTVSSLEPGKTKYAALITAPSKGVQPITFVFEKYEDLKNALIAAETEIDRDKIEIVFHQDRINSYENKIQMHKERIVMIENPVKTEEVDEDDIPMEEV